ncbi:MAG TPA: hypothetical protein VEX35_10515 [Allosphingosinicella sp.]|nr:hypothetical protein [Allosphingosinicella sp.]
MSRPRLTPEELGPLLARSWSPQTSSRWRADNPALGQCGVTALVVHRLCGGEILKTDTEDGPHFYNRIEGLRHDFTASQFADLPAYCDLPSDADEAMAGTTAEQLAALMRGVGRDDG